MSWLLAWLAFNGLIFAWRLTVPERESTMDVAHGAD